MTSISDDPALLTQKEITLINPYFPEFELPIHIGFHCDISYNTKVTKSALVAVSPNIISAFKPKIGQKLSLIKSFYISDICHLYHLPNSVRVEFPKDNLQVEINNSKGTALLFTQILYRNYTLFHYKLGVKYELEVSTQEVEKFPEIQLDISPSQRFQFYFASQCAKYQKYYRHDVCRYMHNLIITNNPVFDFSQIPVNAVTGSGSVLTPLIKSIQITKYIRGICWENFSYPDLLNQLSPLFGIEEKSEGIRMIHLVNCNLTGDLSKIIKCIDDHNERHACFVSYWNLSNNPNLNFENFSRIIDLTLSKIVFLSISNCNIDEKVAKEIFIALANNPNSFDIRHLEIGGVSMIGKSIKAFEKFIKVLNSRHENKIILLDINSCDNLQEVLQLVLKELPDLEILNVSRNKFSEDDFLLLLNYIAQSKKLREIDLSKTKISPDKVAEVIKTFSKNEQLQNVTLKLNELKLSSENLLPLLRSFLTQKESCDKKWHSIHLDSNGIDQEDLLTLIPLFKRFPNLETLSFSHNFNAKDESNKNIGDAVAKLLLIPSLKNLSIAGDKDHQLGLELNQFLEDKNNNLEKIDISGNKIRDSGFAQAIKLIKRSETLKSINLGNNGMKVENSLNDLLSALKQSKNSPTVKFPLFEGNEPSAESVNDDQKQIEISEFFMKQRRKEGLCNELPFDFDDNYANEFMNELSAEFEKTFEGQKRFTHSCVCMKIHLPLPFQRVTDTTTGMRKQVDIGNMEVYQTDSMNYVVYEKCPEGVKNDEQNEDKTKTKSKRKKTDEKEKKKKKEEVDDNDDDKKKVKNKSKKIKKDDDDGSDDNNSDEDESSEQDKKKKQTKSKRNLKKNDDDDEEYESDSVQNNKKGKSKKRSVNNSDDDDDGKKKKQGKSRRKTSRDSSEEESDSIRNRSKNKRRKMDDYSDDNDEDIRAKNTAKKRTKKTARDSSDESESAPIDTSNIVYKMRTAMPKNTKRRQTEGRPIKMQRRQIQSDSESDSEPPDQRGRNQYNRNRNADQNRLKNRNQRKMQNEDSENDRYDNRQGRPTRYDDDIEDEGVMMKSRRKNVNKYDDSNNESEDYRKRFVDVDDIEDENDEDLYHPSNKRRSPPPKLGSRKVENKELLRDEPVKRRVKESNPKLDGTFLDPYYKKRRIPISKI